MLDEKQPEQQNQSQPEQRILTVKEVIVEKGVSPKPGEGRYEVREGANASAPENFVLPEPIKMPIAAQNAGSATTGKTNTDKE